MCDVTRVELLGGADADRRPAAAIVRGLRRAALSTPDLSGRVTEVRLWQNRAPDDEPAEDKGSR